VRGFIVVSQSTFGIISPSPLKRVISAFARPLPCSFNSRSRCASSSAQYVSLPMSMR
jgi:hypothetical protein